MNTATESGTFQAHCKINIHLEIYKMTDRRINGGLHNIRSIFLLPDAPADILKFKIIRDKKSCFHVRYDLSSLPEEFSKALLSLREDDDIIVKAFRLFQKKTGTDFSAEMDIKKRIPAGAGLGGASSCAAAALKIFNRSNYNILTGKTLEETGMELGSDVPFFLSGVRAAYITGRGEKIRKIHIPRFYVVIITPLFLSRTVRAYRMFDAFHSNAESRRRSRPARLSLMRNDFLDVFLRDGTPEEKTAYNAMLADLKESGAAYYGLSGSGSSCFGLYKSETKAKKAKAALAEKWPCVLS